MNIKIQNSKQCFNIQHLNLNIVSDFIIQYSFRHFIKYIFPKPLLKY
jgi:hypothetical protein